jgi:tmRNA-binding protein
MALAENNCYICMHVPIERGKKRNNKRERERERERENQF